MAADATGGGFGLLGWIAAGGVALAVGVGGLYYSGVIGPGTPDKASGQDAPAQTAGPAPEGTAVPLGQPPAPVAPVEAEAEMETAESTPDPKVQTPRPEPDSAQADAGAETESGAETGAVAKTTTEAKPALAAPGFDVVRVDQDGNTVIAGTGPAGARITIFLDGKQQTSTIVDRSGAFVSLLSVEPSNNLRVLSMKAELDGQARDAEDQIILAPSAGSRADPATQPAPQIAATDPGATGTDVAGDPVKIARQAVAPTGNDQAEQTDQGTTSDLAQTRAGSGETRLTKSDGGTGQVAVATAETTRLVTPTVPAASETAPDSTAETPSETILAGSQPAAGDQPGSVAEAGAGAATPADTPADKPAEPVQIAQADPVATKQPPAKPDPVAGPATPDAAAPAPAAEAPETTTQAAPSRSEPDSATQVGQADTTGVDATADNAQIATTTNNDPAAPVAAANAEQAAIQPADMKPADTEPVKSASADSDRATQVPPKPDVTAQNPTASDAQTASVAAVAGSEPDAAAVLQDDVVVATLEPAPTPLDAGTATGAETGTETGATNAQTNPAPAAAQPAPVPSDTTAAQADPVATAAIDPTGQPQSKAGASGTPATTDTEPTAPAAPGPVTVLRAGADGVEVLQSGSPVPEVMDRIALDVISYSEAGEIQLSGRAQFETTVRVYLDNKPVGDLVTDDTGRWSGEVEGITPGIYTLRLDELGEDGGVLSRIETPFKRESPEVLRPPRDPGAPAPGDTADGGPVQTPLIRAITVQRGDTLWAISRERYGDGILYVRVFEANRRDIRDPDLIYPGQVFTLPE